MATILLCVERLSKRFGALSVLESLSFEVRERERGPNGAGNP